MSDRIFDQVFGKAARGYEILLPAHAVPPTKQIISYELSRDFIRESENLTVLQYDEWQRFIKVPHDFCLLENPMWGEIERGNTHRHARRGYYFAGEWLYRISTRTDGKLGRLNFAIRFASVELVQANAEGYNFSCEYMGLDANADAAACERMVNDRSTQWNVNQDILAASKILATLHMQDRFIERRPIDAVYSTIGAREPTSAAATLLVIRPDAPRVIYEQKEKAETHPHATVCEHDVRGHFATSRRGRKFWRRPHKRGDPNKPGPNKPRLVELDPNERMH